MEAVAEKEFQFVRGDLMVLPYHPRVGVYKEQTLEMLYNRLHEEDLWNIVFHENPSMSFLQFRNFFNDLRNLLQVCSVIEGDRVIDVAGMAWVSDVTNCGEILTRAVGSFVFFHEYQKPFYTDRFARILLEYWFDTLSIDTIIGVTPEDNRAACLFIKRAGFKQVGFVPCFTTLKGKINAAIISCMTKDGYLQLVMGG